MVEAKPIATFQTEITRQGLIWLGLNFDNLVMACSPVISQNYAAYGNSISQALAKQIAQEQLGGLVARTSGICIPSDELKQKYVRVFLQGATLQMLVTTVDKTQVVVITRVEQSQLLQPAVRGLLIQKLTYVNQVTKAIMAAAAISVEAQKEVIHSLKSL